MATLRELLSIEELERFQELRRQGMSDELALRFKSRFERSAANLDFLIEHNSRKSSPYYAKEIERLQGERAQLFDYVLKDVHKYNVPFIKGTSRDLAHLVRSAHTDESGEYLGFLKEGTVARESLAKQIAEDGILKFAGKTALSAITTPIEGAAAAIKGEGWGEHPLEFTAKVGSAIPLARAVGSMASAGLVKSGLRAATRELPPDAQDLVKQLARSNASPAQMAEALGGAGFNRARAGELLQKAVQHPAWKVPARYVEGADILGAREEFLSEILGELMLEGAVAGGRAIYNTADPTASQQERRKAENDAAAAERFERINKPKLDAALDANALVFTQITQEIAAQKTELTPEDIANISDELFVAIFDNQIAPQVQAEIDALEAAGLENAGDAIRERMLQIHRQAQPQPEQEGETDAAQPTEPAQTELDVETAETTPAETETDTDEAATADQQTVPEETEETPEEEVAPEPTPEEIEAQITELAVDVGVSALETLEGDLNMTPETAVDRAILPLTRQGLITSETAETLKARVIEQITPEVEARRQAESDALNVPDAQKGTETTAYRTDATPYGVRPVVRELDDLIPSHDIEGNETPNYPQDLQPREGRESLTSSEVTRDNARNLIPGLALDFPTQFDKGPPLTSKRYPGRTVAGTGRTNMLKQVRDNHPEKWAEYQEALRERLEGLGIDPAILDDMDSPVLHYELTENIDELEIAKDTNIKTTLDTTGQEQATQDAETLFDEDVLALWDGETLAPFGSAINNPENQDFRVALIKKIPTHLRPAFLNQKNELSKQGLERIQDAMMQYVFGGTRTAQLLVDEGGIEDAPKIKLMLDYIIADLAVVKSRGLDIGQELDAAIHRLIAFSKRADEAPDSEKSNFDKTERIWKEVSTYLNTQGLEQDSPLERQLVYLLYTRRGAEKQLAEHFQHWAVSAIKFLESQQGGFFDVGDPKDAAADLFDGIIKTYLTVEAFQVDPDRTNEANPWRTPSNLPPELRDIRREIDAIENKVEQTEAFNAWIENFLQEIRSVTTQGDTDARQATAETTGDTTGTAQQEMGVEGELGADPGVSPATGGGLPAGTSPGTDTGTPETPESQGTVAGTDGDRTPGDEPGGAEGDATSVSADDTGSDITAQTKALLDSIKEKAYALNRDPVAYAESVIENAPDDADIEMLIASEIISLPTEVPLSDGGTAVLNQQAEKIEAATAHARQLWTLKQQETQPDEQRSETPDTATSTGQTPDEETQESSETGDPGRAGSRTEGSEPASGAGVPTDANQLVGTSTRQDTETPSVAPAIQSALNKVGISVDEWQAALEVGNALEILNSLATDIDNVDAITTLHGSLDDRTEATPEEMGFDDDEFDIDDDDFFNDAADNKLRDITDQQRSDFETVRRKLFLSKTISLLESKTDRTLEETLQLSALKATQRNDAQQALYEGLLTQFIDRQVARLQAKTELSTTENRILDALVAVQAEGIPAEASDLSLYADLETPEQSHSSPLAETRTLAGVNAPDTSETDVDLPESVTADTTKLSPAQLTSVKAIIAAFTRKIHIDTDRTVQGGFLLADKPGVGKTRQALATIWHYMRQGIQKHFILAPNQQLLNNYRTDFETMGGPSGDISHYDSSNKNPKTPVATTTYSTLVSHPNLNKFNTTVGNQNALADIVEHLTGVRPTLAQTHPRLHRDMNEAFVRIGIHNLQGDTAEAVLENAVTELRRQAKRVNLKHAQAVDQFRQRLTPELADMLLNERRGGGTQLDLEGGSTLHDTVAELLAFAQTHLGRPPDPNFAEAAANFEGVIVLDEMHKGAGTSSQTGQMIDTLTALLPNAKFLYMSATPFKEIDNFYVASRLGLWGANQAFPTFKHFARAFRRAVRAVKEVVPLHLKQIGRYVSRALSSRETRYSPTEIPLTDTEKAQYDTAVQLVQSIQQRFEASIAQALRTSWGSVIENEGQFHQYRAHYMRMFYNQTQKFFLAVLDSMKAQGLTDQMTEQLKNGDKIIVQLENTWDKTVENAKRRGNDTPGPFDLLVDFVENENLFPVHAYQMEVRRRRDGTDYTVVVKQKEYNENGEQVPVIDPQLKRIQEQFLAALQSEMRQNENVGQLPFAADIIHAAADAAGVPSGEISGRETNTDKRIQLSKDFSETTDLNLIVLGPAGLTGINLPVSEKIRDQVGNLYHYLVQSSWNVNTFEQGLGRGKRANSAIDPHYIIAHQDLPGADRVLGATLAKFAEMGALAGQADSALMQNVDKTEGETDIDDDPEADVFDEDTQGQKGFVFGKHGEEALDQLWYDMYNTGDMSIADALGLPHPEIAGDTGILDPQTVPSVQQFFQRLLHQPTARQPQFYQEFETRLKRILEYNRELGTLDTGANDLNSKDGQVLDRLTIYTDPDTGQTAEVVKLSVKRQLPRRSWDFLSKVIRQDPGYQHHGGERFAGLYTDADGNIWAMFENPFSEAGSEREFIRWGPRGTPVAGLHQGENRVTETQLAENFTPVATQGEQRLLDIDAAKQLWEEQDADTDTHVDSEMFMATGMVLPKWQDLGTKQYKYPVMGIIPMADGSNLHGRVIPASQVSQVLRQIGGVDPNYFDPNRAEAPTLPDDPNIDIPALVREIIGEATDPQVRARLEGIVEHIHKKLPLRLRGHLVRSAQEAALLGQLIRDPQVEHVWIVYRREGRIVKIEPMSLNRKGEADAGDFNHIKSEAGRLQADAVLRIHNHPSGVAKWSDADKNVAMNWHSALGTLMAEDIIVDSGTFAYRTFENGQYTWHEDVPLNPKSANWDTYAATTEDMSGVLKQGDPLYANPLIRGAREAATYMWGLKRNMDAAELVFVSKKDGKIMETITDTQLRSAEDPAAHMETLLRPRRDQLQVHVMMWGDDTVARAIQGVEGVDSVWVGSQRITGMEHTAPSTEQTITREIGGTSQTFVRVGDTVSDPNAPKKPIVIAGVRHELVRDEKREDVSLDNRTRGDAEHIVSGKQTLDVSRLDQIALAAAREAIEEAVSQEPDTSAKDAQQAEYDKAEAYTKALENLMWAMGGITAHEALDIVEATPALQTQEVRDIFTSMDPEGKTYGTPHDKVRELFRESADRRRELRSELRNTPDPVYIDKAIAYQVKSIHTELSENEAYRRALQEFGVQPSTVGEALATVEATPVLQTSFVKNLLAGHDPDTRLYHIEFLSKISAKRDALYDRQNKLKDVLRHLRDRMDGWDQRNVFDMLEEINQTYRMSVSRIESGVKGLSEDAQAKINPLLDNLWGHIAKESGVYNKVLESGKILATHQSGDPEVNQGMLAYTSYSAYYRRSEGFHDYGFILDMEKLLEIPGTTGTVHNRGNWSERADLNSPQEIRDAMETWHDPGNEDIVIEVRIPEDIDLNEYLIGVIEDSEVYVKEDRKRLHDINNTLRDYQPSTQNRSMPRIESMLMTGKRGTGDVQRFVNPSTELFNKMRLWTPTLRKGARMLANALYSGYGLLEELKAPRDADTPAPGDVIADTLDERMYISGGYSGRVRQILLPSLKALDKQVKAAVRAAPSNEGRTVKQFRAEVDFSIIEFIEKNVPLKPQHKAFEAVAKDIKEAWRQVNGAYLEAMIQLVRNLAPDETITKTGSRGRERWSPEPLRMGDTTLVWTWDVQSDGNEGGFVTKETFDALEASKEQSSDTQQITLPLATNYKTYSVAEAVAAADGLWYPHQYDRDKLRHYNRQIEALVKALNTLAAEGDQASPKAFAAAGVTKETSGYRHHKAGQVFPDIDSIIRYWTEVQERTETLIKMYENGTVGFYPHLERVRETHDQLYKREVSLLIPTAELLWDRYAEIDMFGQIDPYSDLPPRLAKMLEAVEMYNANDREEALMAVVEGVQESGRTAESLADDDRHWGMHESIPAFASGEDAAYRIMQQWEDYYIDDDGNKVKTGKWKGIDINRLNLSDKHLKVLSDIGFIQKDGQGGYQVYGKTDAAQQRTLANFFVELMQTKQSRRNSVEAMVQALGHYQLKSPLDQDSARLWRKFNTFITIGALGPKQALQNLVEIPTVPMVVGLKSTQEMVRLMANPNFREAAEVLGLGLKQGVEFLSDDNLQERYLDSWVSMFGKTEAFSRMIGVAAGLAHARSLTKQLVSSQGKKRAAIEREMRTWRMDPDAVRNLSLQQVDPTFDRIIEKIKDGSLALGGVDVPSQQRTETDEVGDAFVRSAMYVSDMIFKPYDARTLPPEFQKDTPFGRMFLKFKGWMFQQNRFMLDQWKRALRETKQGNFTQLSRMLYGTAILTGAAAIPQAIFAALQGRDDEDDRILRAFLSTQTLGLTSVMWEMMLRSEGNMWRLEKTLEGTIVGPVWGTIADIVSPAATGDWAITLREMGQRTPVAREALYLGVDKWWEDEE